MDRESTLMHKERCVGEDSRSLEERLAGVTTREGRVQGLEALKVQMDADKAAMEQRRLHLENTETQVSSNCSCKACMCMCMCVLSSFEGVPCSHMATQACGPTELAVPAGQC